MIFCLILDEFPISQYCREKEIKLDQSLRQLAVQAINRWTLESTSLTIQKHFYRAVLEVLFIRDDIDMKVGKLRDHIYQKGFKEYLRAVVEKLKLDERLIEEADMINMYDDQKVITAVCLRGMCSAVVESLILLDRWMAVKEQLRDGYVGLHNIFDSEISPRGWAIVATR